MPRGVLIRVALVGAFAAAALAVVPANAGVPVPAQPSRDCFENNIVSGALGDNVIGASTATNPTDRSEYWVCLSVQNGAADVQAGSLYARRYGGKVVLRSAPGTSAAPRHVDVDTTRQAAASCAERNGYPLVTGAVYPGEKTPFAVYAVHDPQFATGEWICARLGDAHLRLRLTFDGPVTMAFLADQPDPVPFDDRAPLGEQSAVCRDNGGKRLASLQVGPNHETVALYTLSTAGSGVHRQHVCFRGGAYGGRLAVRQPGALHVATGDPSANACPWVVLSLQETGVWLQTPDPSNPSLPAGICLGALDTSITVEATDSETPPTVRLWPDPA